MWELGSGAVEPVSPLSTGLLDSKELMASHIIV